MALKNVEAEDDKDDLLQNATEVVPWEISDVRTAQFVYLVSFSILTCFSCFPVHGETQEPECNNKPHQG